MFISAQVSVYPLRQVSLSPAIGKVLRVFREHGLEVEEGAMSTTISGDDESLFGALREAFTASAEQGDIVMTVTISNSCPVREQR
jgi:uncharacterized protein YqgV (UPF0045/DUF77 family)